MTVGRIIRVGESLGAIIHRKTLRELGWWQADVITQRIQDGRLVLENVTQKRARPIHFKAEFGDTLNTKP